MVVGDSATGDPSLGGWPTRVVVVVASLVGRLKAHCEAGSRHTACLARQPKVTLAWQRNTSSLTFVVYQRVSPRAPNFVRNFGNEAGVYIQFILYNYDDLPAQTLFVQDGYAEHNPGMLDWAVCLRPRADYAPLVFNRLLRRGLGEWRAASNMSSVAKPGLEAIVEQCWRNFLDIFGRSELLPPRATPTVGYYQGALFMASRARLRQHPRERYVRAHALAAGGDGLCHHSGELEWGRLSFARGDYFAPVRDEPRLTKHTTAGAWEHLEHIILGNMGLRAPYTFDWCAHYEYRSACPSSPCPRLHPRNESGTSPAKPRPPRRRAAAGTAHQAMNQTGGKHHLPRKLIRSRPNRTAAAANAHRKAGAHQHNRSAERAVRARRSP